MIKFKRKMISLSGLVALTVSFVLHPVEAAFLERADVLRRCSDVIRLVRPNAVVRETKKKPVARLALLSENIARFDRMQTGDYFSKKPKKQRTFINIDLLPGLIKLLRDQEHYSREEVNFLLVQAKRYVINAFHNAPNVNVEAAFVDFRSIRLVIKDYDAARFGVVLERASHQMDELRSARLGRLSIGPLLDKLVTSANYHGWLLAGSGKSEARATFASRAQREKKGQGPNALFEIVSFEEISNQSILKNLHHVNQLRRKVARDLQRLAGGDRFVRSDANGEGFLTLDLFRILRKNENVHEIKAALSSKLGLEFSRISDSLVNDLITLKRYSMVLEPNLLYERGEIVNLDQERGFNKWLAPQWVKAPDWAAYTDVVDVGSHHMLAMQAAVAKLVPLVPPGGFDGSHDRRMVATLERLHRIGFGDSIRRLRVENARSFRLAEVLGLDVIEAWFSENSGDDTRFFFRGSFPTHAQILQLRKFLGKEQRLTLVRSTQPNASPLTNLEYSRLRELGENLSKQISSFLSDHLFGLEVNQVKNDQLSIIVHLPKAAITDELSRSLKGRWIEEYLEKEYGEAFPYKVKVLVGGE